MAAGRLWKAREGALLGALVLACGLWLLSPGAVQAQAQAQAQGDAEAKALFQRGVEASDSGRWAEAADYYQRSRALVERPSTLFNLVGVLHRLGRYREGLEAGVAYLRVSTSEAEREKRLEVERLLTDMQLAVGVLRLSVVPRAASVRVDGIAVPQAPERYELQLDPGRHLLTVEAPGYEFHQQLFNVERGGRAALDVTLVPRAVTAAPPLAVLPADEPTVEPKGKLDAPALSKRQRRVRRALWATGGVLVLGGLAAIMVAGAAKDEQKPEPTGGTTGITLPL